MSTEGRVRSSCLACMGVRTDSGQLPIHAPGCPGRSGRVLTPWERQGKPDCYSECAGCTNLCHGLDHYRERSAAREREMSEPTSGRVRSTYESPTEIHRSTPGRVRSEWEVALRYISSPTMGLPGGRDALDFVDEASEKNAREALKACIRTARQALAKEAPDA